MNDETQMPEDRAEAEVRAALARAGLQATPEQVTRFVKTHRHMQARLARLQRQLDPGVPPMLVFPAAALAEGTRADDA